MNVDRRRFLVYSSGLLGATLLPQHFLLGEDKCVPTKADILGPYYRPDAPKKTKLRSEKDSAPPLFMAGVVKDEHCDPIVGAVVELWQADTKGEYDNDPNHKPEEFHYRASIELDRSGKYSYETVVPAAYEISKGMYRPKHIHYKVSAPGCKTLVTQAYFKSEVPMGNWGHASLVVDLKEEREKGEKIIHGTFDIVLAKK